MTSFIFRLVTKLLSQLLLGLAALPIESSRPLFIIFFLG